MPKLVQICGVNATGKTTLMRNVIASQQGLDKIEIQAGGKAYEALSNDAVCILGRYNENKCCGIDGYISNKDELFEYIQASLKDRLAQVIFLESVMYGLTYRFRRRVFDACKANGFEYHAIQLVAPIEVIEQRIYQRNGGKPVNMETKFSNQASLIKSGALLKLDGAIVSNIDVSTKDAETVFGIVRKISGV